MFRVFYARECIGEHVTAEGALQDAAMKRPDLSTWDDAVRLEWWVVGTKPPSMHRDWAKWDESRHHR